jgi:hypothetical protein
MNLARQLWWDLVVAQYPNMNTSDLHARPQFLISQLISRYGQAKRRRHRLLMVESGSVESVSGIKLTQLLAQRRVPTARNRSGGDPFRATTRSTSHNNPAPVYDHVAAGHVIAHTGDIVHKLNRRVKFSGIALHAPY